MPIYGTPGFPRQLVTSIPFFFFAQEVPTVPSASAACVSPGAGKSLYAPILFVVDYSVAVVSSTIAIQGAMFDIDAKYQTLKTLFDLTQDNYVDFGLFIFYRVVLSAWVSTLPATPGTLNVTALRK
jgi:hypothetical protein